MARATLNPMNGASNSMPTQAQVAAGENWLVGNGEIETGEVILEVELGLGAPAKNSSKSLATLRGLDPMGGVYQNGTTGSLFLRVSPGIVYKEGKIVWEDGVEGGIPRMGLTKGTLIVGGNMQPHHYQYLKDGVALPPGITEHQEKVVNTRQAWSALFDHFLGGRIPSFYCSLEGEADRGPWSILSKKDPDKLKEYTLILGFRLAVGGQPQWSERDSATVGTKRGGSIKSIPLLNGKTLETLPINIGLSYAVLEHRKFKVVDPEKTLSRGAFQEALEGFLSWEDKTAEGITSEVLQERREEKNELMALLVKEVSKKKGRIKAREEVLNKPTQEEALAAAQEFVEACAQSGKPLTQGQVEGLNQDIENKYEGDGSPGEEPVVGQDPDPGASVTTNPLEGFLPAIKK